MCSSRYAFALIVSFFLWQNVLFSANADALLIPNSDQASTQTIANFWYGPGSLNTVTRGIRDDFIKQLSGPENWPMVRRHTSVFKQFIESLYRPDYSEKELAELHDLTGQKEFIESLGLRRYSHADLKALVKMTQDAGLKCAFEVGALRWSPELFGPGSGRRYAAEEILVLNRWVKAGGSVDYITTDHAVMWNLGLCLQGKKPMASYVPNPDWRMILEEVAHALALFHKAFPNAKIGMIESLGYFSVGDHYKTTDPGAIYPIDLKEFLLAAKKYLKEHNVVFDHMHLDFSLQDCRYDGRKQQIVDYGRILKAEEIIKDLDLDSGIIINAFDEYSYRGGNFVQEDKVADNVEARSESAVVNTMNYFDGYVTAGGQPDTWIFQRWQPYPNVTGPETLRHSDMGITRMLVERLIKHQSSR